MDMEDTGLSVYSHWSRGPGFNLPRNIQSKIDQETNKSKPHVQADM